MARYLKNAAAAIKNPPQSEPLNERQVKNSAGGYVYPVDGWTRLDRFLILGSEGGSYYAGERKLTKDNIKGIEVCVKEDGLRTVKRVVEISDSGRAPKNDPALMALAVCAATGDLPTRQAAMEALPKVARIGTHLFHFVDYVTQYRGWGRMLRNGVGKWYGNRTPDKMADQVTKYQQRDGWSHRDLLRLSKPAAKDIIWNKPSRRTKRVSGWTDVHSAVAKWVTKGEVSENLPERILGHVQLQKATSGKEAAKLIRKYGLVRESVPTELLNEQEVWAALLEKMPPEAMIRNLGKMTSIKLLAPMAEETKMVIERLEDTILLRDKRVHPIQVLMAMKTYESGHGVKGSLSWTPVPRIIDGLDGAFYETFKLVPPTGKRFYLGVDISGSMGSGVVAGVPDFTPREASCAMAMVTVKTEAEYYAAGFTTDGNSRYGAGWGGRSVLTPMNLSPKQRLDDVVRTSTKLSEKMGGTDCSLPMLDAMEKKMKIDVFVVYTDNETWAGEIHPPKALEQYRQKTGIPAKLIVVGMVANEFTIADPNDGGMLDIVGFDTAVPQLMADFAKQ